MKMFFTEAITSSCHQGLSFLRQHELIKDFYLAGGTALALQIGHRVSTDLDWFTTTQLLHANQREQIRQVLNTSGGFEIMSEQDGMLFTRMFGTDVSFIYQQHPLLNSTVEYQGVQLADPTDIGLMKLAAINSRGTRRDFVDIYCMREIAPLDLLFDLAIRKYANRPNFLSVVVRALVYFEDAEQQPMPTMLTPIRWEDARAYCEDSAKRLTRRLSGLA